MPRRHLTGLACARAIALALGLALAASVAVSAPVSADEPEWLQSLQRVSWQAKDAALAAAAVSATAARTTAAGRPVALSALRGDVSLLEKHLTRLNRRLTELHALPIPQGQ